MKNEIIFTDLGLMAYQTAWDYQKKIFDEIMDKKFSSSKPAYFNHLLFCEHPNVYTLGKSGSEANLLIDFIKLKNIEAEFYKTDRGGDITYHGPGQIVGYPLFDLDNLGIGVRQYIFMLEEAIILTLAEYNINAERLDNATGVWLDTGVAGKARKICAIGVKVSRSITMHGFAFNVNTDLNFFNYINPCGFTDKSVTSMEKELGARQDFDEVKAKLKDNIYKVFAKY